MFCHKCGTKGIETATFCRNCGTKLRKVKTNAIEPNTKNIPPKPDKVRKDDIRSERIKELDRKNRPPKPDKARTDDIRSGAWKDRHKNTTKQNDYDKIRREQAKHSEEIHNKTWDKKNSFSKSNYSNRSNNSRNRNSKSKPFPLSSLIILGILILGGVYLFSGSEYTANIVNDNVDINQVKDIVDDNVDKVPNIVDDDVEIPEVVFPSWNSADLSKDEISEIEEEIERLINIERVNHGSQPLIGNALLWEVAHSHSLDMVENKYYEHVSLDGKDPTDRGLALGYYCEREVGGWIYFGISENLNIVSGRVSKNKLASTFVDEWMNSPGHKENLLDPMWIYGEVAIAVLLEGSVYYTIEGIPDTAEAPIIFATHNFGFCPP